MWCKSFKIVDGKFRKYRQGKQGGNLMYRVDLNSDLGESFGNYTIGMDEEILKYVSSANVACGWHAGDAMVMEKTVALAKEFGTAVGAHPGFPDLVGFGRRNMAVTPDEAKALSATSWALSWRSVPPHTSRWLTSRQQLPCLKSVVRFYILNLHVMSGTERHESA